MRILLSSLVVVLVAWGNVAAQTELPLMPMPASVTRQAGELTITPSFTVSASGDARLERAARRFLQDLYKLTGVPTSTQLAQGNATLAVTAERPGKNPQELGEDESYRLEVTPHGATIHAPTTLGAMAGLQTLLQLVQPSASGLAVPALIIQDQPRFPWRGLLIDTGRHFMPQDVLKRNLDAMAAVKLNVFHWHFSDDQGFRVESKLFPRLHQMGSDGLYHTQAEIREIIEYARDRGIRVVPELDMPAHATAWFVGYPELASGKGPYEIERRWGVFDPAMDPTRESTYEFLNQLIGEMTQLFPDAFFHVGGDEVNGKEWDANPGIQAFMKARVLRSNADLQTYFNQRVLEIVTRHHRRMIGWDEVFHPDLPKTVVVHSWRGPDALAKAARLGHDCLVSGGYYLELNHHVADYYGDPLSGESASLTPEQQKHVLGGEAAMWTEMNTPELIDSRNWPAGAAVAERFWSPASVNDVASMYRRLDAIAHELDLLGLHHNRYFMPMLRRMAGTLDVEPLRVLADVVEPLKVYNRPATTQLTPMNRLSDAARPESRTARIFNETAGRIASGQARSEDVSTARQWLTVWSGNHPHLEPMLQRGLLNDLGPVSQNLARVAAIGLQALDYLDRRNAPTGWASQQGEFLVEAAKPNADLLIAVVPGVRTLVTAVK
jgi:hexosaminidase